MSGREAVLEMGGITLPTLIGLRAAFEWLAVQEGKRPDWYSEEAAALLDGVDASRRLLAAVDAVLGKHKPAAIYGECECDDETLDSPDHEPIGLMDMEACSNSFQFWACRECCFVNDYNTEECATYHVHTTDKSQPCCVTVQAVTEALGADR